MLNVICVICAESFTAHDDVHSVPCGHIFHNVCLKQWLDRSPSCPQCRFKCSARRTLRIYFNLGNLDTSHVDIHSLQDQLENVNSGIKEKEKALNKVNEELKKMKETQKKNMKTIISLETKLRNGEIQLLASSEQINTLKTENNMLNELKTHMKLLQEKLEISESISTVLKAKVEEVDALLKNEHDPKKLAMLVIMLKREFYLSEQKRASLLERLKTVQLNLCKEVKLKITANDRISQLESENKEMGEKLETLMTPSNNKNNTNTITITTTPASSESEDEKPTTSKSIAKENNLKSPESESPYLKIKSSSVGLLPLFQKRRRDVLHPYHREPGAIRKTSSELNDYTIFNKQRSGHNLAEAYRQSIASVGLSRNHLLTEFDKNPVHNLHPKSKTTTNERLKSGKICKIDLKRNF